MIRYGQVYFEQAVGEPGLKQNDVPARRELQ